MRLPIQPNQEFLNKGLVIPRLEEGKNFSEQEAVLLQHDSSIGTVTVDMQTKVQQLVGVQNAVAGTEAIAGLEQTYHRKAWI